MINGLITEICQIRIPVKINLQMCLRLLVTQVSSNAYKNNSYCAGCSGCGSTNKCKNNSSCDPESEFSIQLGWKCLFGSIICRGCKPICDGPERKCCGEPFWSSPYNQ